MSNVLGRRSPVLERLASLYAESTAGQTGIVSREFGMRYEQLLALAQCERGSALAVAEEDLRQAERLKAIEIVRDKRSGDWQRVRVPLAFEAALFGMLDRSTPTQGREQWSRLFAEAATWPVPPKHATTWGRFCCNRGAEVRAGRRFEPFQREKRLQAAVQLQLVAQLLTWDRPCLLRTASAHLCHHSKRLGLWRGTLEKLLAAVTEGAVTTFADLGIEDNPTAVRIHGPLRVRLRGEMTDYSNRAGEYSISENDLDSVDALETTASHCITIENPTTFHELTRRRCGALLVCTSYPNEATVRFLRMLPAELQFHHFGDTDPWGFDVLLTLREKTQHRIEPMLMLYRPKSDGASLDERDERKLRELINSPLLADVRSELLRMAEEGRKGDFEQERLDIERVVAGLQSIH